MPNRKSLYFRWMFIALLLLLSSGMALAGDASRRPLRLLDNTRLAGRIELCLGEGRELYLPHDIGNLSLGSTDIADVMLMKGPHPRTIRIVGKSEGRTNLIISPPAMETENNVRKIEYLILVRKAYQVEVINGVETSPEASLSGW
ncbi:pilus assembly protein N-terminal domain-containing protein [uncultured Desulfosarcina sp.]|uniref:pilus assembly protein N-terminal domain-containing protein n=1 Tax=uncultured Desulfosarcina sp. TaxID=218289 RepID=UPI0029C86B9A|nr:pilus assembly protein N-terminal domain-containing protein [uncultured Desulfosarcina sp.]